MKDRKTVFVLTGHSVRVHFKVGDVVPRNAAPLCTNAASPGAHGRGTPSLMDLIGNHLQVLESCLVFAFCLKQLDLPLIHSLLQVLGEKNIYKQAILGQSTERRKFGVLFLCAKEGLTIQTDCSEVEALYSAVD